MSCDLCKEIVDREDIPHVVRICNGCGREMHVVERGDHGRGIRIEKGEKFVIPAGWMQQFSPNPLKSKGTFTRPSLQWFAEQSFIGSLFTKQADLDSELKALEEYADRILQGSPLIGGLDIDNPEHEEKIFNIVKDDKASTARWAVLTRVFLSVSRDA